jgi:hypothetical protein
LRLQEKLKLAGIIIVLASFFCISSTAFAISNNVAAFGDLGGFANPANLSRLGKATASANIHYLAFNNAIPAMSFLSGFEGPYFAGSSVFAQEFQNYEMVFGFENVGFAYRLVDEKDYISTGDTVRAMQDFQNNSHIIGKTYDIDITGEEAKKEYFSFYFSTPVETEFADGLWLGANLNIINGISYQNGNLNGTATQLDATTTQFVFDVATDYSDARTHGRGYSLDLGASCQMDEKLSFEVLLENVFGYMTWQNVNYITATGSSENVIIDGDGNITNNPSITGFETARNISKTSDFKSIWGLKYKLAEDWTILSILEPYANKSFFYLGTEWSPHDTFNLKTGYGSKYDAASIGVRWQIIKFMLFANNISLSSATSLGTLFCLTI